MTIPQAAGKKFNILLSKKHSEQIFKAGDQACSPTEQRSSLATLRTASRKPDGMKPFVFAVGKTKTKIISLIGINGGKAHFKMVAKQMTHILPKS